MGKRKRRKKIHRYEFAISTLNLIAAIIALLTAIIQLLDD